MTKNPFQLEPLFSETVWGAEKRMVSDCASWSIKFLSTHAPLSVQVHPRNISIDIASDREIWCILEAEPQSRIHIGLSHPVSREEIIMALRENSILSLMNEYRPNKGDCFIIPAGTLHCLGAGITAWEVSPSENKTLRLYDWGRHHDKNGTRELHVNECLKVLFPSDEAVCGESVSWCVNGVNF